METLPVGEVAARLGVSASTLRMWGERYGLTASARTDGGHRRYTSDDLERLHRMHRAVIRGDDPAVAAAAVTGRAARGAREGPGGPGGRVLAVPGAGRLARGLARAAHRLDEAGAEEALLDALEAQGTVQTWDSVIRPVLAASGDYWARTGEGIEVEHLLTQAVMSALVRHTSAQHRPRQDRPVLLAGAPHEQHTLALYAVRAALAERGVPARLLGPRTPSKVLVAACRRTRAAAVFVWLSIPDPVAQHEIVEVRLARPRLAVVVGGAGWHGVGDGADPVSDLSSAARSLERAWRQHAGKPTQVATLGNEE